MCFPCWPIRNINIEDEEPQKEQLFQYIWNGTNWVPTIGHRVPDYNLFMSFLHTPFIINTLDWRLLLAPKSISGPPQLLSSRPLFLPGPRSSVLQKTKDSFIGLWGQTFCTSANLQTVGNPLPAKTMGGDKKPISIRKGRRVSFSLPPSDTIRPRRSSSSTPATPATPSSVDSHPTNANHQFTTDPDIQREKLFCNTVNVGSIRPTASQSNTTGGQPRIISPFGPGYQYPPLYHNPYYPNTMSDPLNGTVASGVFPDPHAQHFQPAVPSTENGPFQHVYHPRFDPPGYQAGYGGVNPTGNPHPYGGVTPGPLQGQPIAPQVGYFMPLAAPSMVPDSFDMGHQFAQPGMATAPIPIVGQPQYPQGLQHPLAPIQYQPPGQANMVYPPIAGGMPGGYMVPGGNGFCVAGNEAHGPAPGPGFTPPDVMGIGKTGDEHMADLAYAAQFNKANEPQDMKPADDNPSRMYWCRELNGDWTHRSRFSIDRMDCWRWYVLDGGVFYAVRTE
ncbi:hypothetical protein F5Y15DRAFT_419772 [Xylariaceae sp. FL0016]|nr:hypothetical protein F5Y15DRAFT_419772 [Xylariaceae sp. FL0016]